MQGSKGSLGQRMSDKGHLKIVKLTPADDASEQVAERFELIASRIRKEGGVSGCAVAITFVDGCIGTEHDIEHASLWQMLGAIMELIFRFAKEAEQRD